MLAITAEQWPLIEGAARLLETPAYVPMTGEYGPWFVGPTFQGETLGYVAVLASPMTSEQPLTLRGDGD